MSRTTVASILICLAVTNVSFGQDSSPKRNPFFAICMDTHDSQKRTLAQQAQLLKELGFDGAGHLWLDDLKERIESFDAAGLKLYQVYLRVNVGPKGDPFDARLESSLPLLKGRDAMLALLVEGMPPLDRSADVHAVEIIRKIADLAAKQNVRVVLYPHAGDWVERVEDAIRVVKKVERPNVGVMFNLCHWLKVDDEKNLKPLLDAAKPYLFAVSINGSDTAQEIHAGKGNWIQPLDSGSFDIKGFLAGLKNIGYTGPIGLQCYGIEGDARAHLTRSVAAWHKLNQ